MIDYKKLLADVFAKDSVGELTGESDSSTVEFCKELASEKLPIYTATQAELNYWHAFGSKCELQALLREYDLGFGSKGYDRFKVGYNTAKHFASLAIDETHYYKIPFTEYDSKPIDKNVARQVLKKLVAEISVDICKKK